MSATSTTKPNDASDASERCPHCGSTDLEYGDLKTVGETDILLGDVRCRQCGKSWKE
jgi:DNA-directed RNA polymerase subunit M/transcription elongation factor TFIIS